MQAAKPKPLQTNNFDLLRLLAALQVVVYHTVTQLSLESTAWFSFVSIFYGVPIFFVISGFLISASWESKPDIRLFARNRLLRILPGLWACLVVVVLVASLFGYDFFNTEGVVWFSLQLVGLIFTPNFLQDFGHGAYNGSLWTIPVELQFYCLIPLIYALSGSGSRRSRQILAAFAVFFVVAWMFGALRSAIGQNSLEVLTVKLLHYSFLPHVYMFLFGILLQRSELYRHWILRGKGHFWLLGYIAFSYLMPDFVFLEKFKLLLLGATAISCAYTVPTLSRSVLGRTDISYGVYIYHGVILNVMIQSGWTGEWRYFSVALVLSCIAGYISWVCIERPCIRRKTYSVRTQPQVAA